METKAYVPSAGTYIALWLDPVRMVEPLRDRALLNTARRLRTGKYIAYVNSVDKLPSSSRPWSRCSVRLAGQGMPLSQPDKGVLSDMCTPIALANGHPKGWVALHSSRPFPYLDCNQHAFMDTVVRIPADAMQYDGSVLLSPREMARHKSYEYVDRARQTALLEEGGSPSARSAEMRGFGGEAPSSNREETNRGFYEERCSPKGNAPRRRTAMPLEPSVLVSVTEADEDDEDSPTLAMFSGSDASNHTGSLHDDWARRRTLRRNSKEARTDHLESICESNEGASTSSIGLIESTDRLRNWIMPVMPLVIKKKRLETVVESEESTAFRIPRRVRSPGSYPPLSTARCSAIHKDFKQTHLEVILECDEIIPGPIEPYITMRRNRDCAGIRQEPMDSLDKHAHVDYLRVFGEDHAIDDDTNTTVGSDEWLDGSSDILSDDDNDHDTTSEYSVYSDDVCETLAAAPARVNMDLDEETIPLVRISLALEEGGEPCDPRGFLEERSTIAQLIRSARADGLHSLCTRNPLGVLSSPSLADLARTTIIMSNPVEIPVVSSFVEDPIPDDGRVGSVHEENVDIACTHAAPSHLKAPVTGDSIDIAASETPSAWWRRRTGVWPTKHTKAVRYNFNRLVSRVHWLLRTQFPTSDICHCPEPEAM